MNAASNEVTGIHSILQHDDSTYPANAVDFALESTGVITTMNGFMGYITNEFGAGVYGKTPETNKTDYAGYFTGHFNAKLISSKSKTPTHSIDVDSLRVDGLSFVKHQTNIVNTIDWTLGPVVNIDIDDNNRQVVFSKPPIESQKMIIKVNHTGTGKLTFTSPIKWLGGVAPLLTSVAGREDFVIIAYHKKVDGSGVYYGSAIYDFR